MKKGKSFDIANSIFKQLPFFACYNTIYDPDIQKDIQKYLYCKEYGVSPYSGSYKDQPYKWVNKSFMFRNVFAKKENNLIQREKSMSDE